MSSRTRHAGVALATGAALAVQSRVNGDLGDRLDDGLFAAWLAFLVGLPIVLALSLATSNGRSGYARVRPAIARGDLRRWQLLGGLGGAIYVVGQSVTVATLGVALFTVATVAGQSGGGAVVDAVGLAPGGRRPITALRAVAGVLSVLAVAVAVVGVAPERVSVFLIVVALLAGIAGAFQSALNAQVAETIETPLVASVINFVVGLAAITMVMLLDHAVRCTGFAAPPAPWAEPLLWSGGLLGVLYTVVAAWVVRDLGVLLFGLCIIAGSLAGAVVLDLFGNAAAPQASLVVGVTLTFAAVLLAAVGSRPAGSTS